MTAKEKSIEERIDRLHADGVVDCHFDMPMDLYEKRNRTNVVATDYLPELETGNIGILGAAIYIEDRYLPEIGLRVALDQIARLYAEAEQCPRLAICKSYKEILGARKAGKIALLITMEGVEPLGTDVDLLRVFYELGVRSIGLTHARRNAAGDGGVFAPTGSSGDGLTALGRDVVLRGYSGDYNQATDRLTYECAKILRHRAQRNQRTNQNDRRTTRCDRY